MALTNVITAPQALQRSFDETAEGFVVRSEYSSVSAATGTLSSTGVNLVGLAVVCGGSAGSANVQLDSSKVMEVGAVANTSASVILPLPVRLSGTVTVATAGGATAVYVYHTTLR